MESLEKSRKCFSLKNTQRTRTTEAPDAVSVRPVCSQCLAQLGLGIGHQAPDAGLSLFVRPVVRVWCAVRLPTSLHVRPVSTGQSGAQRPVIEHLYRPLYV